jgi:predicted DNA-binding transcriptional regulator YafY
VPLAGTGPTVDPDVLTAIAAACRDFQRLRFDYRDHGGTATVRTVEPHRLVSAGRRWYLVAWDVDRQDWRTFRVDRVAPRTPTGPRFTPRDPPGGVAAYVERGVGSATWRYRATVRLHVPAEAVADKLPAAVTLEPVDEHSCLVRAGSDTLSMIALYVGLLDVDFDVVEPPELREHIGALAERYGRAAR